MLELGFITLMYLLEMPLWWLLGLLVIIHRFFKNLSLTLLILFSPVFWISGLFDISRIETKGFMMMAFEKLQFNLLESIAFICFSLLLCFVIYLVTLKIYKKIDPKVKHPLVFMILFFILIHFIEKSFQQHKTFSMIHIAWIVVYIFFSNAFVMMAYELKAVNNNSQINPLKRFLLLNTLHASYMPHVGTQLSPKGVNHLLNTRLLKDSSKNVLKVKALKVLIICLLLKIVSDFMDYFFLGLDVHYLARLQLDTFDLIDLNYFKTLPRFALSQNKIDKSAFALMLVLRDISWLARKVLLENQKIGILWFFGFYVNLAALNPMRSTSFVDFFRRIHVYLAHFYRTFIFQYVLTYLQFVRNRNVRKYLAIWLMIFFGGLIHQTVSHSYQVFIWGQTDLFNVFSNRIFYDSLMATIICFSIYNEKRKRYTPAFFKPFFLMVYIFIYTFLMSIHASSKARGFGLGLLFDYFKILFDS